MKRPTIIRFVREVLGLSLSAAQETLLRAFYGLALTAEQLGIWTACTGREIYPGTPSSELTAICGARSGKDSRILAPVMLYESVFGEHLQHLGRGEKAVIPVVAQDARGARVLFGYLKGHVEASPMLSAQVEEILAGEIHLKNGTNLAVFPNTLRSLRGWSIPCAGMDEAAFWKLEGQSDSDVEIQASIRRGMLGFPSPKLLKASTAYMRSGLIYDDHKRMFGQDDPDGFCWVAPTSLMNPTISEARLDRERRLDPSRFAREFLAEFTDDLSAFLPTAWVEAAILRGVHELPFIEGTTYMMAVDPSGAGSGSNADTFTATVVHAEGSGPTRVVVQDVLRGWKSRRNAIADLEGIVAEIVGIARAYRCGTIRGDRYSGSWMRQAVERHGLQYIVVDDKSTAYLASEPLFAQGRIRLLDHELQRRELLGLERRARAGGKAVVDHPAGRHDDYANVLALAAAAIAREEYAVLDVSASFAASNAALRDHAGVERDDDGRRVEWRDNVGHVGAVVEESGSTSRARGSYWRM